MRMRTLLTMSFVAAGVFANASFNQLDNVQANLTSADNFGVSQIFETANTSFNAMALANFTSDGGKVTGMEGAFEFSRPAALGLVKAWRVSIFTTPAAGFSGGTSLLGIASVDVAAGSATTSALVGSGSTSTPTRVTLTGLNLACSAGVKWIGMAAILDGGANNDQAFVMRNGNGNMSKVGLNANDDVTVQPGDGFGFGGPTLIDTTNSNAAYSVTTAAVPEPATMVALGAGLLALARRRRNA